MRFISFKWKNFTGWPFLKLWLNAAAILGKFGTNSRKAFHEPRNKCSSVRLEGSLSPRIKPVVRESSFSCLGRIINPKNSMVSLKNLRYLSSIVASALYNSESTLRTCYMCYCGNLLNMTLLSRLTRVDCHFL